MRTILVFIFTFIVNLIYAKLCPFFKNDGLICQKEKIKGILVDRNHDRLISYGLDNTAIMWDLQKMNDLKQISAQNSQIISIYLDQDRNNIIILNQNGYLSILSYPQGQKLDEFQITDQRVYDISFFHSSLPLAFIITMQNRVQVFNYHSQTDSTSITMKDKIIKHQTYERGDYSYIIFYLQNGQIIQYKIKISDITNKQIQTIQFDNSELDFSSQGYLAFLNSIAAITKDRMRLVTRSFDYNTIVWEISAQSALIVFYIKLDDALLIALFLDNNKIQIYSQRKGTFLNEILIPSNLSTLIKAYNISLAKKIIFHDGYDSIFICSYTIDGNITFIKKRISFYMITNIFQAESYIIMETEREAEGFFVYNSIKESLDTIKCLVPQTNFEVGSYQEPVVKKLNSVVDLDNSIVVRFFLTEIDAWNFNTNTQIFYDDSSLKKFTNTEKTVLNEILDVAIDSRRGILVSIQLDKTIAVWDYWSGTLITLYQEIEPPTQIFYLKNKLMFVIKEVSKIIVISQQDDINLDGIMKRNEIIKPYSQVVNFILEEINSNYFRRCYYFLQKISTQLININEFFSFSIQKQIYFYSDDYNLIFQINHRIQSMSPILTPSNLFIMQIYKIDSVTGVKTDYFKFFQIESQLSQLFIDLPKGQFATGYDVTNNILIYFFKNYISIISVDFTSDSSKIFINANQPKIIQLKINSNYQFFIKEKQKQILIATDTKLFNYSYLSLTLQNEVVYSKISKENIQLKYLEADNIIILYNSLYFQTLDGNSYNQIKNYLNDQKFQIQQIFFKLKQILVALSDQRIIIFETSNLKQLIIDFTPNNQVQKFIEYQETNQLAIVLFQDGTIGTINTQSPFYKSVDIQLLNSSIWMMKHFIKDDNNNLISFNAFINNQYYVAKVKLENLTVQKYRIQPITWNNDEISEIQFLRLVSIPQYLYTNDETQDQNLEQTLVFQKRTIKSSNITSIDMFLYDHQTQNVIQYKQNIFNTNITKIGHGLIPFKAPNKKAYISVIYSQQDGQLKIFSLPTLEQINQTLFFQDKLSQFQCEFNSAQVLFSLEGQNTIQIYNIQFGKVIKTISSLLSYCTSMIVDYEQNILIIGESIGRISVFQYSSFIPLIIIPSINSEVTLLYIDQTQKYLTVGSVSNKLYLYQKESLNDENYTLRSYNLIYELQFTETVSCVQIEAQLNVLFTCQPGIVKAWNLQKGNILGQALVDSTKQIIKKLYFSIYSRLLIICTKQNFIVYDSLYITNFGFMMNTIQMKTPIKEAVYLNSKGLLVYSQLMNKKSIGFVEFWDANSEKLKMIHSGTICKPIQIINIESSLIINCKQQLLAINSNDLTQKSVLSFKNFQIQNEIILQSKYNLNYLYGVNKPFSKITLYIVCIQSTTSKPNVAEYSSIYLQGLNSQDSNLIAFDYIDQILFLNKDFILITDYSGQILMATSDLKYISQVMLGYQNSLIQGIIKLSQINEDRIRFITYDQRGDINILELQFEINDQVDKSQEQSQDQFDIQDEQCFSEKNEIFQLKASQTYYCKEQQFKNVSNLNLVLINSYSNSQSQFTQQKEIAVLEKANCIAFVTPGLEKLLFISLSQLQPIQEIFIPFNYFSMQLISCRKSNLIILLTNFQINIYSVLYNELAEKQWIIFQQYSLIDSQLGNSLQIIFMKNNLFLVVCQNGYKVLELQEQKIQGNHQQQEFALISKQIAYLDSPTITNIQPLIDSIGQPNMQIRGYHQKGLFMHIIPLVQDQICLHEIMETDFLLVEKTLKFLETTYDNTIINFDSFYIMIHLNQMKKLFGLPDLRFKYNSTIHMKGQPYQKKVIGFQIQQNQKNISLDVGSWDSFILENAILLPMRKTNEDPHYELNILNSNNGCKKLTFIGVDFNYTQDSTQIGINPPSTDKYLHSPLHLVIKNISNVTFQNSTYKYQKEKSSTGIQIINSQFINIINLKIDSCYVQNATIIKAYSENLSSNRTTVNITQLQVSRSILNNTKLIVIDNAEKLLIENVEFKYNQGRSSLVFFLSGITQHSHKNSLFFSNSGISYMNQQSIIQKSQLNSFDYRIQNSILDMSNIQMYNNVITKSIIMLEVSKINMTQIQLRNINFLDNLKIQQKIIQNNLSSSDDSSGQSNTYKNLISYDLQNTSLHFENKQNFNSYLLSSFYDQKYQNSMSIPNIFIDYEDEVSQHLSSKAYQIKSLITIKQQSNLIINSGKFENLNHFEHIIYGKNINVQINSSFFRNITGDKMKGILFFSQSKLKLNNSIFRDNVSFFCTCIYIQNEDVRNQENLITQNTFHNNTASLIGGSFCGINAIFSIEQNIFHLNQALVGGAIYYYYFKNSPYIQNNLSSVVLTQNIFTENQSKIFGQNIGSSPKYLKINQFKKEGDIYLLNNFRSGGYANLNFMLYDEEDKPINIKEFPQAIFVLTMQDYTNLRLNDYSAIQLLYNETLDISTFQFTKQQIIGIPGKSAELKFITPSMPNNIENQIDLDNANFSESTNNDQYKLNLDIIFRNCEQGEVYSQDTFKEYFTCRECSEGLYSLIDPESVQFSNQKCMLCPKTQASQCQKSQIFLNPGFWRFNNNTDHILECFNNPKNCAGNDTCIEGHLGPLCEDCDIEGKFSKQRYSRVGMYSFECAPCNHQIKQYIFVTGLMLFMSLYLMWSVKQSIDRAKATIQVEVMRRIKMISLGRSSFISLTAAYIKIAADYFQIVSGLKYFAINYPNVDLVVDSIGDSFSKTSYSLDCFLVTSFSNILPLNYARIIWIHVNALIYLIIFAIIYKILVYLKVVKSKFYIWTNALILFSLFTQYSIMSILISSLSCRQIGDKKFVKLYVQMECWGEEHFNLFTNLLLPLLLIQILTFVIKLYLLISIKNKLNNFFNILKYGLLYLEYTPQNYLWEFIKTFKRFLVTLFINLFDQNNQIKGIMCSIIFIFYYILLSKMQPFRKTSLNSLEKLSTIVQLLLYFLAILESQKDKYQSVFSSMIFSINLIFLLVLLYKVIKKNKSFVKITYHLNRILQNKFPKLHSCYKVYFKSHQSQTRILWRNLAWVVGDYLKRRKKDKNAQIFGHINSDLESAQRYKLKDMRSSQQIQQFYTQQQTTIQADQTQINQDIQQNHLNTFSETIQNSTTLEMVQIEGQNKLLKNKSLLISDSIILEENKSKPKKLQKSITISSGGLQSHSFKNSLQQRNQKLSSIPLIYQQNHKKEGQKQNQFISENNTTNSEVNSSNQQTETTQRQYYFKFENMGIQFDLQNSNSQKQTREQLSNPTIQTSTNCIPSEYDEETDSIFTKYNAQYISNNGKQEFQIKKPNQLNYAI